MSRKSKNTGMRPIERIELDATILDVVLVDKDGQPVKRPTLFTATNVHDRLVGVGYTAEDAIKSLREEDERRAPHDLSQTDGQERR